MKEEEKIDAKQKFKKCMGYIKKPHVEHTEEEQKKTLSVELNWSKFGQKQLVFITQVTSSCENTKKSPSQISASCQEKHSRAICILPAFLLAI